MIKIKKYAPVFIGLLCSIFVFSEAGFTQGGQQMLDEQTVFVYVERDENIPAGRKLLKGTRYVRMPASEARNYRQQHGNIQTFLPQNYTITTNDPLEPQGYLTLLAADDAWAITTGSDQTIVAVIDSGFALEHEDLVDRWYINQAEVGAVATEGVPPNCTSRGLPLDKSCNNLDDDGNGYVDDWRGWDFANEDNDVSAGDVNPSGAGAGHGTSVSGMVGATGNNGVGVASLNWATKILPIQVFTDDGAATTLELAQGIVYAIEAGADVINMSLGTTGSDPVIDDLLEIADAAGISLIAAAGNCGDTDYINQGCSFQGQMLYPATNNLTIAVAATNLLDNRASFSSQGTAVDVAAPGSGAIRTTRYVSTDTNGGYSSSIFGTSFSAPIVSGLSASIKNVWPASNPKDVRAVMVDSAVRVSQMESSIFTQQHGFGRIDPAKTLTLAQSCVTVDNREDINCDGSVDLLDLSKLASQWNLVNGGRSDINQTGATDLLDLSLLASKWGQ